MAKKPSRITEQTKKAAEIAAAGEDIKIPSALQKLLDKGNIKADSDASGADGPSTIVKPSDGKKPVGEDEPVPFAQVSKTNPFGTETPPPARLSEDGTEVPVETSEEPLDLGEDEETLGDEFGLSQTAPTVPPLPEDDLQSEGAEEDPEAEEGLPSLPPADPGDFPIAAAEEAPENLQAEAKYEVDALEEALAQLEEQRKINKALRQDFEKLVERGGNVVPQEFWNIKHKCDEAKAEAERLQEENDSLREELSTRPEGGGSPMPVWEGKEVRILFPCYKQTNPVTAIALIAAALDFGKERIGFDMEMGDAVIENVRNILADRFLKTDAKWSLWIDDDIIPPFGRADMTRQYTGIQPNEMSDAILNQHFVGRLMSHGKKIIGATYFGRRRVSPPMFKEGIDNAQAYQEAKTMKNGIRETEWVATGCLLVHRDVYLDIQKKFPRLGPCPAREIEYMESIYRNKADGREITGSEAEWIPASEVEFIRVEKRKKTIPARLHWDFFRKEDGSGEDVAFCKRARGAGHQVYVDTGLQCLHLGYMCYGAHNTTNQVRNVAAGMASPGPMAVPATQGRRPPTGTLADFF
jgi:hypothetical protein